MELHYVRICRVQCCTCKAILEYRNQSKSDQGPGGMMVCNCGQVALDPAASMYRIVELKRDAEWKDFSEPWVDFDEHIPNAETIAALKETEQMRLQPGSGKDFRDQEKLFPI